MDQTRFSQIDEILDEILDAPANERPRLIDARCEGDAALKKEVLSLLDALETDDDFIESPEFVPAKNFLDEADEFTGKKIGAYRLKKLIGRGGMSAVYLASRIDDFEKEVAVKIIPPFENRRRSADNFRRERQILARLSHPFIAQILDGGTTDGQKPYIVMEYVDGLPLDDFCRTHNFSEKERLTLFQDVCRAVTFAHQNLIVHRDLKPNNILVNRSGQVKLLDFGIAKLLDKQDFNADEQKTFDGLALTFEYASPEQIAGENITVASDVYSLGVILYELLTDTRPHNFKNKSFAEILKIIKTEKPPAPSKIPNHKSQITNRELDLIVLKALAKTPDERYRSVEEFRADIENYLQNLPISARPATFFYRLGKYVRRRKLETAIAALFILVLLGWLVTAILQTQRAERQARENRRTAYSAEMILAASEYENANLNRLKELVEKYESFDDGEDLRGFEWYFLNNLLNPPSKIGTFQHPDEVWSAEFSPDGQLIASACNDNRARVWNLTNGQFVETAEQKGAWRTTFFPDGKRFAVSSSSNTNPLVKIYETATAAEILTLRGHTKRIRGLDVSPDGKQLATGSQDGNVIVWDAENGAELKRFSFSTPERGTEIQDVRFSPDGTKLVASGFELLSIINTKTWQEKRAKAIDFLDRNVLMNGWKAVFSPLGKTLALGTFEGNVVFLDAETLAILRVLKIHQSNVKSIAFSNDGKILATASWDRTIKFVDVQTGEIINELRGHFSGVHEIFFSPDGKTLATAGADSNLNLWNAEQVAADSALLTGANFSAFTSAGDEFFTANNQSASLSKWRAGQKSPLWSSNGSSKIFALDFSPVTNRLAIGESSGGIVLFDAENRRLFDRLQVHSRPIHAVRLSPDGKRLFAAFEDGLLKAFDAENLSEIYSVKMHEDIFKGLDISPDGRFLATGGNDNRVKVSDAATGQIILTFQENTKPLYKTVFAPDGQTFVSTGADNFAQIRQTADGKLRHTLSGMSGGIFAVSFAPDGKRLATASDGGVIRLWNTATGEQVLAFTASQKTITQLRFTNDGKTLVSIDSTGKVAYWSGS